MTTLAVIDMGEKPRCKTAMELMLDKEDEDLKATLEGETVMVDITAIEAGYKNSIRLNGRIVRAAVAVPTADANTRTRRTPETAG